MKSIEENLKVLADYSPKKQSSEWGEKWWNNYYTNMIREGYYIPPFISYIVFSSCNNSRAESGINFKDLVNYANYKYLSDTFNQIAKELKNNSLAFRLGKFYTTQLSCSFISKKKDSSELSFNAQELLNQEIDCLENDKTSLALEDSWFKKVFNSRYLWEIIGDYNLIPFIGRERAFIDPFLGKCFKYEIKRNEDTSNVCGDHKQADNKSHIIGPVGKFEKMDVGKLPDSIDRLSPIDLTLLYKGMNSGYRTPLQKVCKDRFLLKASNGELWQKYSSRIANSNKMPSVIVQIDFFDSIEFHKITKPPRAPRVTTYRALLISLIMKLISCSKKFNWSLNFLINHRLFELDESVFISEDKLFLLGNDREELLKYFMSQIPSTFVSGLSVNTPNVYSPSDFVEYDLWARIVLGKRRKKTDKERRRDNYFSSNDEIGIKINCDEKGEIILRESYSAEEADEIELDKEKDKLSKQLLYEKKHLYEKNKIEFTANFIINMITGNQEMSLFE